MTSVMLAAGLLLAVVTPGVVVAYPRPGDTARVSVASDGTPANEQSRDVALSSDARYVAFASLADNLVADDTNDSWDIFVHDRQTGATERVSVGSSGTEANGLSLTPAVSGDGRYVAFHSEASNLVDGDTNGALDVFVHDRQTGVTERVSVGSSGTEANGHSGRADISADGRYVAFESSATRLVDGDTNNGTDIFVHDREAGATERVSVTADGTQAGAGSFAPAVSADGRYVSFGSFAPDLVVGDTNIGTDIFVHDRETGATERVSVTADGTEANCDPAGFGLCSVLSAISANGRFVVFTSHSPNLVPNDTNEGGDVFVHDRETGATERVSVASDGTEGGVSAVHPVAITSTGRYVSFSGSADLVGGGFDSQVAIFVHDRETRATERVSVTADEDPAGYVPDDHAEGRYIGYASSNAGEPWSSVFVRDRGPAVGIGELSIGLDTDSVAVTGSATFSGHVVTSATDPDDDDGAVPRQPGAELTGASLTSRPENEDLLVRLALESMPSSPNEVDLVVVGHDWEPGPPAVLYGFSFDVGGVRYEARANARLSKAESSFALHRCDPACVEVAALSGAIGSTGLEVLISVPLSALELGDGAALSAVRAFTALGTADSGALLPQDEVGLPDAAIPTPQVELGIAPADTPEEQVTYTDHASVTDSRFTGTLPTDGLPAGDYRVWARACLGDTCGTRSTALLL